MNLKRARKLIEKFKAEKIPLDPLTVDTDIENRKYQVFNQYLLIPNKVTDDKLLGNKVEEMEELMKHNIAASVLFNKEYEKIFENGYCVYCFSGIEELIGRKLKLSDIKKLDIIYFAPKWFDLYQFIHIQTMPDGTEVQTPAIGLTTICRYDLLNKDKL